MVLKLYGYNYSSCTKRVALVLNEKNVPFEYIVIDLAKGEHKTEAFLKQNPFGAVPYIDDDGFILYESRAICWYIATKYADQGTPLLPADLKKQAMAQQALSIEMSSFDAFAAPFVYEKLIKPMYGATQNEGFMAGCLEHLSSKLDAYETILSKQKYLSGDDLTLADLYHLPVGSILPACECDELEKRPAVAKWFKELAARPAWQAITQEVKSTAA